MNRVRGLVFDLGGVLLHFNGVESLSEMSKGRIGPEEFSRFWSQSPWAERLHRGRCSPEDFAAGAVRELSLPVTPAEFLSEFRCWLAGPYPGAFDLLSELRPRFRVACLSNTNVLDVERFGDELRLQERFDLCFFSNEIGLRKPHADCYLYVASQLELLPQEIVFVDDSPEYVAGAQAVGMRAYRVDGFAALLAELKQLGIVDAPIGP